MVALLEHTSLLRWFLGSFTSLVILGLMGRGWVIIAARHSSLWLGRAFFAGAMAVLFFNIDFWIGPPDIRGYIAFALVGLVGGFIVSLFLVRG